MIINVSITVSMLFVIRHPLSFALYYVIFHHQIINASMHFAIFVPPPLTQMRGIILYIYRQKYKLGVHDGNVLYTFLLRKRIQTH